MCSKESLNDRERYYQDLYDVIGVKGLNCKLTTTKTKSGRHSDETRRKISIGQIGRKHTDESKKKMSIIAAARKHSDETKRKMSISSTGMKHTKKTKQKMSENHGKSRKVTCIAGSKIFNSITDAATFLGVCKQALGKKLRDDNKNNTSMRLCND